MRTFECDGGESNDDYDAILFNSGDTDVEAEFGVALGCGDELNDVSIVGVASSFDFFLEFGEYFVVVVQLIHVVWREEQLSFEISW